MATQDYQVLAYYLISNENNTDDKLRLESILEKNFCGLIDVQLATIKGQQFSSQLSVKRCCYQLVRTLDV